MTHRNGSTEPPTQPGWYWFEEESGDQWMDLGQVLCFVPESPDEDDVCVMDNLYYPSAIPLEHLHGTWHGPLQPPWEPQQ